MLLALSYMHGLFKRNRDVVMSVGREEWMSSRIIWQDYRG